ncbi:DUF4231 domain-containing protein [Nonomuraea sp. NPDC050790]|uniref:DUF4231 domain-containing protein n=1 Tax=Nonomuraea sp. NPDC050790 TaxID=3364371 RepID=UPI0037B0156D
MSRDFGVELRENAATIDQGQTVLRGFRTYRRLRAIWLIASLGAVGFLGWAMFVGVWNNYRAPFTILGTLAASVSTALAAWHLIKSRPEIDEISFKLSELRAQRIRLAAEQAANPVAALRIYRVSALDDVQDLEQRAKRNRSIANIFQWIIIIGSIGATSLTGIAATNTDIQAGFRWAAAIISALVSISAGASGFFKFRERSFGQQQTADAIKRHYKAAELRIGEYDEADEEVVLSRFANNVESLKDEQRKRELQLEDSPERRDQREI